ncbi:hypothetical protein KC220_22645, partial [Mycobacterium tuberculosis]|nr:hypothetical protein [Mycobacterium tuberculosis]
QSYPAPQLIKTALRLLQQPPIDMDKPTTMLEQAVCQWHHTPLQGKQRIKVDSLQNLLASR